MNSNKLYYFKIPPESLKIKRNNIVYLLGYKKVDRINKSIIKKIDYYIKKCIEISTPNCCYIFKEKASIDYKRSNIKLNEINFKVGEKLINQLRNTETLTIFIGTAGIEIEKFSKKLLGSNKYLEGYIVDLIGSEIAEAVAGFIYKKISNKAKLMNLKTTNRFSPGYCTWNVAEQLKLFKFFPDNKCNISLTEKGLMIPIKSVSGIVGIGRNVEFKDYICEICNQKSCVFRLIRKQKKSFNFFYLI